MILWEARGKACRGLPIDRNSNDPGRQAASALNEAGLMPSMAADVCP